MPNQPKSEDHRPTLHTNVACPFCSLLCDDLSLSNDNGELKVLSNGCHKATLGFEQRPIRRAPTVNGKRVGQAAALNAAANILRRAQRPLISISGTDVEGMRETVRLAERTKAILDNPHSAGFDQGVRVLQSRGWFMTTLGEVRNRADLIIIVGADLPAHYPNFSRRIIEPKEALHPSRRKNRRVIYLGDPTKAPALKKSINAETLACKPTQIAEVLAAVRGAVGGRSVGASRIGKLSSKRITGLAEALKNAEYAVFVWAPGQLVTTQADLTIRTVTELIGDLNETQRAAGIALGGDNGGMSAANVCTWLTGYPLHVSFAGSSIEYDPLRYRTADLIENNALDVLLWIDAFDGPPPPATAPNVKRIVLGTHPPDSADVFVPLGTPGVDQRGRMVRTDSVISIEVDQLVRGGAHSLRKVVGDLLGKL